MIRYSVLLLFRIVVAVATMVVVDQQTTEEIKKKIFHYSTISTSCSVSSSTNRQSECEEWLDRGSSLYFVLRREDTRR